MVQLVSTMPDKEIDQHQKVLLDQELRRLQALLNRPELPVGHDVRLQLVKEMIAAGIKGSQEAAEAMIAKVADSDTRLSLQLMLHRDVCEVIQIYIAYAQQHVSTQHTAITAS